MKRRVGALLLCVLTVLYPAWAGSELRLGILAFRPAVQATAQWQPLALALQTQLGRPVTLTAYDLPGLENAVASKAVDVVFTTPGHFVVLKHRYGLSAPLATQMTRGEARDLSVFGGVVFTRADKVGIDNLSDLAGKRIAVASTDFTGGYQMQAYELLEAGLPPPDPAHLLTTGLPQRIPLRQLHGAVSRMAHGRHAAGG